jgi:tellurite resistance protein
MAAFLRRMANSSHMSVELNNMMEILSDHQEFDAGQFATINRITSMNSCEYETCSNRE